MGKCKVPQGNTFFSGAVVFCLGGTEGQRRMSYIRKVDNGLEKLGIVIVAVNKKHLLEFKHRIPLNRVDTPRINGEVKLTQVRFQIPTESVRLKLE